MEESYKAAQMELLTLAKMAERKSQKAVTQTGDVDLDKMFQFLSEETKELHKTYTVEKSAFSIFPATSTGLHELDSNSTVVKSAFSIFRAG